MGLDCYASRSLDDLELTEEDERAFEEAELCLCGGVLSGSESSFRGKVYASLVRDATGIDIYQDLTPEQTAELSRRLDAVSAEQLSAMSASSASGPHPPEVCASLQRFFRICAERGLGLLAWS